MFTNRKQFIGMYKWAFFSLFFCLVIIALGVHQIHAKVIDPEAAPPEKNMPDYINIGGEHQAKQGALRLGSDAVGDPYEYQLEVVGEGGLISNTSIEKDLRVESNTASDPALYVDAINNKVCIGACLDQSNTRLEVSGNTRIDADQSEYGIRSYSAGQALYGWGSTYGIQGVSSSADGYGIWASSPLSTALEGVNINNAYSGVAGFSTDGIGIYGANTNYQGLWAGYFDGRTESTRQVIGRKFVPTSYPPAMVQNTSGQVAGSYTVSGRRLVHADSSFVWTSTTAGSLYKSRISDMQDQWEASLGAETTDGLYDSNNFWAVIPASQEVKKINADTGIESCSYTASSTPTAVTFDGSSYWVATDEGRSVIQLDSDCNEVQTIFIGYNLTDIIFDGTYLWAVSDISEYIISINPSNPSGSEATAYAGISGNNPGRLLFDNYYFWVINQDDDTVTAFYLRDGMARKFNTYQTGTGPADLVFDGMHVWIMNTDGQSVSRLLAADPTQKKDIQLNFAPTGIGFDGTYIWISGDSSMVKLYSGVGHGTIDVSNALALQTATASIIQRGYAALTGSARVGGNASFAGDITTAANSWGTAQSGDVIMSDYGDTWAQMGNPGISERWVLSFLETDDGTIYAGTFDQGNVYTYDADTDTWTNTGDLTGATYVYDLIQTADGTIYASTGQNGDVFTYNPGTDTWTNTGEITGAVDATSLLLGRDGVLYVGVERAAGTALFSYNPGTDIWTERVAIPGTIHLSDMIQARDNILYIAARPSDTPDQGDVYKYDPVADTLVNSGNLAGATRVYDLLETADGTIYAATHPNAQVFEYDRFTDSWTGLAVLPCGNGVWSLLETNDGALYAGTNCNGDVYAYDFINDQWDIVGSMGSATLTTALYETSDHRIMAGTAYDTGVFQLTITPLSAGTYSCPDGHFVTSITTNSIDQVIRVDCRPL